MFVGFLIASHMGETKVVGMLLGLTKPPKSNDK